MIPTLIRATCFDCTITKPQGMVYGVELNGRLDQFRAEPDSHLTFHTERRSITFTKETKIPRFGGFALGDQDPRGMACAFALVYSLDLNLWVPWGRFLIRLGHERTFEHYARYQAWADSFTPLAAQPPQPSIPVESITGPKLLAAQALASGSTSDQAAAVAQVSPRTIENWKKEPGFRQVRDTFVQAFAANPFPTSGLHLIGELAQALTQCQDLLAKQGKPLPAALKAQIRKGLLNSNTFLTKHGASSSLTNQEAKP